MKRTLLFMLLAFAVICGLLYSLEDQQPVSHKAIKVLKSPVAATKPTKKIKHLFIKNDSLCVTIGDKIFCIKKDETINNQNSYAGIYEIKKDSIIKSYSLAVNNRIYFTTFDDGVGHTGYLYVFDAGKKRLIKDADLKHNYLFSFYGIFIIDRKHNKIFSINPNIDDQKRVPIVAASMYSIEENRFKLSKIIYGRFNNVEEDSTMVKFYHRSLANNAKRGLSFPNSRWK